jgi:hypothetical protein
MVIRYAFPDNVHDARNTRCCSGCRQTKSVAEFPWRKDSRQYSGRCYDCKRAYELEWKRRKAALEGVSARRWTPELIETLRDCIIQGMTPDETAAKLGRSRMAVYCQRAKQSLPRFASCPPPSNKGVRPVWTPDRIAELKRLRDARKSLAKCAAILGTTRNGIAGGMRYLKEAHP